MPELKFRKVTTAAPVIAEIGRKLDDYLKRGNLLLLLSGGSAIALELEILRNLADKSRLVVTLNDERFGPVGHPDSNWQQLAEAGFGKLGIQGLPVLQNNNLEATTAKFNETLAGAHSKYSFIVTILGMGGDGHTSGILPGSPAVGSTDFAVSYEGADYSRISNTFRFLKSVDEAFAYVMGESKHAQIDRLSKNLSPREQPIQIIKDIPRVTFYNDYKGEL